MLQEAGSSRAKAPTRPPPVRRRRDEEDPDMAVVGAVIEGSRFYILAFTHVFCRALGVLLVKESLEHLEAPILLVVCHQLPLLACLWALASYGHLPLEGWSAAHVQGAVPAAACTGLMLVAMFASLNDGHMLLVVAVASLVDVLVDLGIALWLRRGSFALPNDGQKAALGAACAGVALLFLTTKRQSVYTLAMLAVWSLAKLLLGTWRCMCAAPDLATHMLSPALGESVRRVASSAASMQPPTATFLSHALSAGPVLALGFLFREGAELVAHDISVPSLSIILMSAASFVASEACRLLIAPSLSRTTHSFLDACFLGGVLIMFSAQMPKEVGVVSFLATIAVAAGIACYRNLSASEFL